MSFAVSQSTLEDQLYSYAIGMYVVTSANGDPLPGWLSFDAATGILSGTPGNAEVGTYALMVSSPPGTPVSASFPLFLTVTNVNDAPEVITAIGPQAIQEDTQFNFVVPDGIFADVDANDSLGYTIALTDGSALPSWLSFDAATRTLSGTPLNADVGNLLLRLTATDLSGASAHTDIALNVLNTNDAPTVVASVASQMADEDATFSFVVPEATFADVDVGDSLGYSITLADGSALPSWLSFDAATRTLSGTPLGSDIGSLVLRLTATDLSGAAVHTDFTLAVENTNDAPVAVLPLGDRAVLEGEVLSFSLPADAFADEDIGDQLHYIATLADGSALPSWLSFDSDTRSFSGTPSFAAAGTLNIRVTATDISGASVNTDFSVVITNRIVGTAGNDNLVGTTAVDVIEGLGGNDTLNGGASNDTAIYAGAMSGYQFGVDSSGRLTVLDINTTDDNMGNDTLTGIEHLQFADGVLTLPHAPFVEFRVNTYTTNDQQYASIAALADGGFVVTWTSTGQEGSFDDIYAQRYGADGARVGVEFRVSTTTTKHQQASNITALADGGFIVTWKSASQSDAATGIYAQRYDGNGIKVGAEFSVNSYNNTTEPQNPQTSYQSTPGIAALANGGFVVTWNYADSQHGSGYDVYAQRYDANGVEAGSGFRVNSYIGNFQRNPSVAALADGGFVITWQSDGQDGSSYGIYAQRYDLSGVKVGVESRVNTYTTGEQADPNITTLADGGFVITWQSSGQDGDGLGIYAQRYDANGIKVNGEFLVNTHTVGTQTIPNIATLADGGFVITWGYQGQEAIDGIYAQRYDANGTKAGGEFLVNSSGGNLSVSSIAALADGGFVVTWQSLGQDGSGYGIYAQRYDAEGHATLIEGDGGNNTLTLSGARATLAGGAGNDSYVVDNSSITLIEQTNAGIDTVRSSVTWSLADNIENLTLTGSAAINGTGNTFANAITGNSGVNTLSGSSGNDTLNGSGGNDSLSGGSGDDTVIGGSGNDLVRGGSGDDTLTGSSGTDDFRFETTLNATTNVDTITDFVVADDTIQLDNSPFTKLTATGALAAGNFKASTSGNAADANDYILYETDTGKLFYDADGNGSGAKVQFALVGTSTHPTLTAADFQVV